MGTDSIRLLNIVQELNDHKQKQDDDMVGFKRIPHPLETRDGILLSLFAVVLFFMLWSCM